MCDLYLHSRYIHTYNIVRCGELSCDSPFISVSAPSARGDRQSSCGIGDHCTSGHAPERKARQQIHYGGVSAFSKQNNLSFLAGLMCVQHTEYIRVAPTVRGTLDSRMHEAPFCKPHHPELGAFGLRVQRRLDPRYLYGHTYNILAGQEAKAGERLYRSLRRSEAACL
jgi:hypothetical protein